MVWSRCSVQYAVWLNYKCLYTQLSEPLHWLLWKSSIQSPATLMSPTCSFLRQQNYVPVTKLQLYRLSLPKGSVSSDDRTALEVTRMSHFTHQGFFEDA